VLCLYCEYIWGEDDGDFEDSSDTDDDEVEIDIACDEALKEVARIGKVDDFAGTLTIQYDTENLRPLRTNLKRISVKSLGKY
jgi:hypothetical protein